MGEAVGRLTTTELDARGALERDAAAFEVLGTVDEADLAVEGFAFVRFSSALGTNVEGFCAVGAVSGYNIIKIQG